MRRLPPLNALRAFEAAARAGSFSRAADELAVTPAAVSQHIRGLEDYLGVSLCTRTAKGIVLTEYGRRLLPNISRGFDHFVRGIESLRSGSVTGALVISVLPSFASRWLNARLADFRSRYPDIDTDLISKHETSRLELGEADVGIRYGAGGHQNLEETLFLREDVFPVCSPTLMNGPRPIRTWSDLQHHVLLHDSDTHAGELWTKWRPWLEEAGVNPAIGERGPKFNDTTLLLQAAVQGDGVAIGRGALMGDDLEAGRLVRPFDRVHPADFSYYLVTLPETADVPRIAAFREWIVETAARDSDL